ncbi:MAG: type II toxin-antitoxin system RelE/ParE family toxin [Alphaproteobacteria bacterium]|nr:type II toxin-antitoxin system RelE/ParE family toxin [Alphaproteobacteria bacterium]
MTPVLLTPRAQGDVEDIWSFTAGRWGIARAEGYIRDIQAIFGAIGLNPSGGQRCDHIRPGYFRRRVGAHVVFYRMSEAAVVVVRILHGRMDFARHM